MLKGVLRMNDTPARTESSIPHPATARDILHAARSYAQDRHWPVFPVHNPDVTGQCSCGVHDCRNAGKHPRTQNGLKDATTDAAQIDRWWTRRPEANIGTGAGADAGVFVVDIDPGGGYETADALQNQYGAFPATLAAQTGGGGLHLIYAWPETGIIRNSAGKLGPGIDVRGEGGYFIAPPSLHRSGQRYLWTGLDDATEVAQAPAWLLALLVEPAAPTRSTTNPLSGDGSIPESIPDGERNSTLTGKAGILRRYGFNEAEIMTTLERMNADRCRPPLPDEEVARIAKSVARYTPEPLPATVVRLASGAELRPITRGRYGR